MKDLQKEIPELEKNCKSTEKELAEAVKEEQELSGKVIYLPFHTILLLLRNDDCFLRSRKGTKYASRQ